MKNLLKKSLCLVITLCMVLSLTAAFVQAEESAKPVIYVIGDSTAERNAVNSVDRAGWAQVVYNYFNDECIISNWALSGESTKRLYNTWWPSIAGKISAGDYVLIQLGHNDIAAGDRYADPLAEEKAEKPDGEYVEESYKWFLNYYVQSIRAKGAYPILVTSIERQWEAFYTTSGEYDETKSQLYNYVNAMKKVGKVENVPVIDVWTDFRAMLQDMGEEDSLSLFISDKVHLNRTGAMKTAKIFAENLNEEAALDGAHTDVKNLAKYLVADIASVKDAGIPAPSISEDFNGTYTDGAKMGFPFAGWRLEAGGQAIKNKSAKHSLQSGTTDFALALTSRKATDEEKTANSENYTGAMENYMVRYTFEEPVSEGFAKYSFRMKVSEESESIAVRVGGLGFGDEYYIDLTGASYQPKGTWHTFDFYMDIENSSGLVYCDGTVLTDVTTRKTSAVSNVYFALARTIDAAAEYYIDDVSFSAISESTYNEVAGVLPEKYLIKDDFNRYSTIKGWAAGAGSDSGSSTVDRSFRIITEQGADGNKVVEAWSRTNSTTGRIWLQKSFEAQSSGYLYITYSLRNNSDTSNLFYFRIQDKEHAMNFQTSELLGKFINGVSSKVSKDNWNKVEYYLDLSNGKYTAYVNGKKLISDGDGVTSCSRIDFSYWRTSAGENASILIDNVEVKQISGDEYTAATTIPEDIVFSEGFDFGAAGSKFTTTAGGWNGWHATVHSKGDAASTIKFAADPKNTTNQIVEFNRGVQKLSAFHELVYDFAETLKDGCYSVKFKIAPSDADTKLFWLRIYGESTTNTSASAVTYSNISFDFDANTITVPGITYVTNGSVKSDRVIEHEFKDDEWCDIEFVFDMTGKPGRPLKLSLYVDGEEKVTNLYFSNIGASSFNDGTITKMSFLFPESVYASTLAAPTTENPLCAQVNLDDIVMRELHTNVVDVIKSGNEITGVKIDAGWKLLPNQNFVVAAYSSVNGNISALKGVEILTAENRGYGQTVSLKAPISIDDSDIVKVFFLDMNNLTPLDAEFVD